MKGVNGERFTVLLVILSAFTGTQRTGHNGAQRPFLPRQAGFHRRKRLAASTGPRTMKVTFGSSGSETSPKLTGLTPELVFVLLEVLRGWRGFAMGRGVLLHSRYSIRPRCCCKDVGAVHKAQRNVICLRFPQTLGVPCVKCRYA